MRESLLEHLACPRCGGALGLSEVAARSGAHVMEGALSAACCALRVPIRRGVPRFVEAAELPSDQAATAENFAWEWQRFQGHDRRYAEQLLGWLAPVTPEFFAGKRVLEGGCGKGRHTRLAAEWGARAVVALDLSDAVDVAFEATRELPAAHVVQADLLQMPLRPAFDYAFSVGVLHHLPDPRAGFLALRSRVRAGGHLSAWIYGAENNGWITGLVDPVRKRVTSRMDKRALLELARLPAAAIFAATKLVYGPLSRSRLGAPLGRRLFYSDYLTSISAFGWEEQHHIVFDQLVAPTAFYVPRAEFERWWRDAGIADPVIGHHNANSWRGFGQIPGG